MALIKCTECGKEISNKANTCPNCGCPIDEILEQDINLNIKQKVKNYSELTSVEKSSIRLYMKSKGESSSSTIILSLLGIACILIGAFVGFGLLLFILGFCLTIAGMIIQIENEKKYYYKHPNSSIEKKDIAEHNKQSLSKLLPMWFVGGLFTVLSLILKITNTDYIFIANIFSIIGKAILLYGCYKLLKNKEH